MKRIVALIIIGILIPSMFYFPGVIVLADPPNVYYVANDGNDGNSGTSQGSPWRTIGKVNSEFGNAISAGDDIYFKRGDTFNDEQLDIELGGISAYGTGDKPIIRRSSAYCIMINNNDYITIENLILDDAAQLILIGANGLSTHAHHITIQNCNLIDSLIVVLNFLNVLMVIKTMQK